MCAQKGDTICCVLLLVTQSVHNFSPGFEHNVQSVSPGLAKKGELSYNIPRYPTDTQSCRALYFVLTARLNHIVINILCFCY